MKNQKETTKIERRAIGFTAVLLGTLLFSLAAIQLNAQIAYIANTFDNTITVIDTATDKVAATIAAGKQPSGVALTLDGKKLFVTNHRAERVDVFIPSEVTVIDTATNRIIANISLTNTPGGANGVTISQDGDWVYVATGTNRNEEGNAVTVIDANTYKITTTIPIPPERRYGSSYPYALALSPGGEKLYVTHQYGEELSIIDTRRMVLEGSILLREGRRWASGADAVAITPDGKNIFVGGYRGELAIVDAATGKVAFPGVVASGFQFAALAITPDGNRLLMASNLAAAYTLDIRANMILRSGGLSPNGRTLFLGNLPGEIGITSDGRKAYITNRNSNSVSVIDINRNTVIGVIPVGWHLNGIAIQRALPGKLAKQSVKEQK